jgi:hypothetical protein
VRLAFKCPYFFGAEEAALQLKTLN